MTADSPSEALRRRSEALLVVVGYPSGGWEVTFRREPSGPLLRARGDTVDEACATMLAKLDQPARKLRLKQR
jgi:hypothetical protein